MKKWFWENRDKVGYTIGGTVDVDEDIAKAFNESEPQVMRYDIGDSDYLTVSTGPAPWDDDDIEYQHDEISLDNGEDYLGQIATVKDKDGNQYYGIVVDGNELEYELTEDRYSRYEDGPIEVTRVGGFTVLATHDANGKKLKDAVVIDTIFDVNDSRIALTNLDKKFDKLLYLLLTFIPPRRLHDFRHTKNSSSIPDDTVDKSFNYYFDKHIYIYNTKNKKFYDFLLPDEIIPYISTDTEFILGNKLISAALMSQHIKRIFKKIYDYPYNATLIRRLYSTYSRENLTKKEIKQNAIAMGHSLNENYNYSFVNKQQQS
jgi:hypothetical protein